MQYFWEKGYELTSLQNLLDVMHLSKSSFYQTYSSKHKLFQRCINHYQDSLEDSMLQHLKQSSSGRQFIEDVFNALVKDSAKLGEKHGCLIMNTASEFAQRDPIIADLVTKGTNKFNKVFFNAVKRAQKEGDVSSNKDPRVLANYLISSMSGLKTMVKAGMGKNNIKNIVDVTLSALD